MSDPVPNIYRTVTTFSGGSETWVNTFDVTDITGSSTPPGPTASIINALIHFYEDHVFAACNVVQMELRYVADGPGRMPILFETPIWVEGINHAGQRDTVYGVPSASEGLDFRAVGYARKINAGRVGKLFLRQLLFEGDVGAGVAGHWFFPGVTGAITPALFHAQVVGTLAAYLTSGSDPNYKLAVFHQRAGVLGGVIKTVDDMQLAAASWHRRRH